MINPRTVSRYVALDIAALARPCRNLRAPGVSALARHVATTLPAPHSAGAIALVCDEDKLNVLFHEMARVQRDHRL